MADCFFNLVKTVELKDIMNMAIIMVVDNLHSFREFVASIDW